MTVIQAAVKIRQTTRRTASISPIAQESSVLAVVQVLQVAGSNPNRRQKLGLLLSGSVKIRLGVEKVNLG